MINYSCYFSLRHFLILLVVLQGHFGTKVKGSRTLLSVVQPIQSLEDNFPLSVLSVVLEHGRAGPWAVPQKFPEEMRSLHNASGGLEQLACHIRMYAIILEPTFQSVAPELTEAVALLKINSTITSYSSPRVFCHISTSYNLGSDFKDTPKTLGLAIYCPVTQDMEMGERHFKAFMPEGAYCTPLAKYPTRIHLDIRASLAAFANSNVPLIKADTHVLPYQLKSQQLRELGHSRPHGVCIVQNFVNSYTSHMLFLAVSFWQLLGFTVIVYDRWGAHEGVLASLLKLRGVQYRTSSP